MSDPLRQRNRAAPLGPWLREHAALPCPHNAQGRERRVGVEFEFGGLREVDAAGIVQTLYGGTVDVSDPHNIVICGSKIGKIRVELDAAMAKKSDTGKLMEMAIEASRVVVPVEIVTDPLPVSRLPELEPLIQALRKAGATGTEAGLLLGFGVHFNPELASQDRSGVVPVFRAFALLEDWVRGTRPIDLTRRALPFVDPYPRAQVDDVAKAPPDWTIAEATESYLRHNPTRNRGLDMLPVLAFFDEDRVNGALPPDMKTSARPAFHYRLPDCRIDEDGWDLRADWMRWCLVERIAGDASALADLATLWRDQRKDWTGVPGDWRLRVDAYLREHGHWSEEAPA